MNPLIPLLVAIPLAGAFLTMILGRFIPGIPRYMALATLLLPHFHQLLATGFRRRRLFGLYSGRMGTC